MARLSSADSGQAPCGPAGTAGSKAVTGADSNSNSRGNKSTDHGPSYPASWSRARACASCGQSKVRCIWPSRPGHTPCLRCSKSGSRCTVPETLRRRKRGPSTRVSQLEERVDGIMTLLTASKQQGHARPAPSITPSPGFMKEGPTTVMHPAPENELESPSTVPDLPPACHVELPSSSSSSPPAPLSPRRSLAAIAHLEVIPGFRISAEEADLALQSYRETYLQNFPFVPLPDFRDYHDFSQQYPFLFKTIVRVVMPQDPALQRQLDAWFREYIAQELIVRKQERLELLQGLLVSISNDYTHFYIRSNVTDLIQLMTALVIDLGLDRSPMWLGRAGKSILSEAGALVMGIKLGVPHTLAEMRAVLGCFFISSVISCFFRRMHLFPFTSYLGHCLDTIQQARELESDLALVAMVRMQRLVGDRLAGIVPGPEVDFVAAPAPHRPSHGSLYMNVSAVRKDLTAMMDSLPQGLEKSAVLLTFHYGLLVRLYEPFIYSPPLLESNGQTDGLWRTEALWYCLQSLKDYFAAFLAVPTELLLACPFVLRCPLAFSLVTATRLLLLADSDWDGSLARKEFDLADICYRAAERFDAVDRIGSSPPPSPPLRGCHADGAGRRRLGLKKQYLDDRTSVLMSFRDKLRWVRSWYLSKGLHETTASSSSSGEVGAPNGARAAEFDGDPMLLSSPALDESFWQFLLNTAGEPVPP